jgi:ribonucleoside-diphosphate reductase alpha chain
LAYLDDQLEVGLASIDDMPVDQTSLLEDFPVEEEVKQAEQTIAVSEPVQSMSASTAPDNLISQATMSPAKKVIRDDAAPLCFNCGNQTQRAGSCYVCSSCGSTTGCS